MQVFSGKNFRRLGSLGGSYLPWVERLLLISASASNDYSLGEFSGGQECLGFMRQAACFKVIKHLMRPKTGISVT